MAKNAFASISWEVLGRETERGFHLFVTTIDPKVFMLCPGNIGRGLSLLYMAGFDCFE